MTRAHAAGLAIGLLLLATAGGCGDRSSDAPAAQVDTTNSDAMDGVSSEQVQAQAEALTPEQAAARGIAVDTTIHVESPVAEDSAAAPDSTR